MTNSQSREWIESALRFWINRKPDRRTLQKQIDWNIKQLTAWQRQLP